MQADLRLTPAQVRELDAVYTRSLPERLALRHKLDALERKLDWMLREGVADDATAAALVTRVEDARTRHNCARTRMLLAMYRVLAPAQRVRLARLVPGSSPVRSNAAAR